MSFNKRLMILLDSISKPKLYWTVIILLFFIIVKFTQFQTMGSLMIKNLTTTELTITKATIDNTVISTEKMSIFPETQRKQFGIYARFEASNPKVIEISIENSAKTSKILKCDINNQPSKECLYIAYIKNTGLTCVCDSYNDFDN